MEPAMALCVGVAAVTLSLGVAGAAGTTVRRLSIVRVPIPVRPLATLLTVVTLLTVLTRTRPATATVAPPIVRLADDPGSSDTPVVDGPSRPGGRSGNSPRPGHRSPDTAGVEYIVEPGDCLWRIARSIIEERTGTNPSNAEIARFWPVIYEANRGTIGSNPNLIFPGQRLAIPER
jgi:nucleoid-associated protein YgaU